MSERSGGAQEEGRKRDVPPRLGKKKQFDGFVQDSKVVKRENERQQKKKKDLQETQGKKRKDSLEKEYEVDEESSSPEKGKDQQKQPRQKRKRKPESAKGNGSETPTLLLLEHKGEAGQLNHDHPDLPPTQELKELHRNNSKQLVATPIHIKPPRDKVEDSTEDEVDASLDPAYAMMPSPTDPLGSASKAKRPKFPIGHDKAAPEPTTISAARRIKQFPNQGLRPHPEEECLYCEICCTSVSRIKQRIRTHLQTFKHRQGMGGKICREQVPPDEGLYVDPAARMQAFNAMITASSPPEQLYGDLRGLRRIMDGNHYFQPR